MSYHILIRTLFNLHSERNKGQVIWQTATSLFYHICQVVAHVAKLVLGFAFRTPILGEREVIGVNDGTFESAMVVSYRLSVVIIALSINIWSQFAIECLRRSNQQGMGQFWEEGVD